MAEKTTAGEAWAHAITTKDRDAIRAVLAPEVDFKALTPRKFWEATEPETVMGFLFDTWFDDGDHIESAEVDEGDAVEDTSLVRYRFAITNADGPHTVEQQAYYRTENDRINYLRIVCSGYRPVG